MTRNSEDFPALFLNSYTKSIHLSTQYTYILVSNTSFVRWQGHVQTGPNGNQRPNETCLEKRHTQCKAKVGSLKAAGTDNFSAEGMELSWPRNLQLQKLQLTPLTYSIT